MNILRKYLTALLRGIGPVRRALFLPKGISSLEKIKDFESLWLLDSSEIIQRDSPNSVDDTHWKFLREESVLSAPTFVIKASGWRVWGNQGAVITQEGFLFKEVSREFEKPDHSIFNQFRLVPPKKSSETVALLTASGADIYYHWMFDILPRLGLLKDVGVLPEIDAFLINFTAKSYQIETLEMLGVGTTKIIETNDHWNFHYQFEKLFIPSLPSNLDTVSLRSLRFLRQSIKKAPIVDSPPLIYLRRITKRRVVNDVEVESFLKSKGFVTVLCEDFSVAEQAYLFSKARIIIGPHGAGFSNIAFCEKGASILEFFSPNWVNPCYWTICNELGLNYSYLLGEGIVPGLDIDPVGTNDDITVDITKLAKLFEKFVEPSGLTSWTS